STASGIFWKEAFLHVGNAEGRYLCAICIIVVLDKPGHVERRQNPIAEMRRIRVFHPFAQIWNSCPPSQRVQQNKSLVWNRKRCVEHATDALDFPNYGMLS